MSTAWYVHLDQQQKGPYSIEQLKEMALSGQIRPDTRVWSDGMADWINGSEVEGLFSPAAAPPPPVPGVPSPAPGGYAPPVPKKKSGLKLFAIIGISVIALIAIGLFVLFNIIQSTLRSSGAYSEAMSALQSSPLAIEALGEPIEAGSSVRGSISVGNGSGDAVLTIPVSGPKSEGSLEVEAYLSGGRWNLEVLELQVDNGEKLNLLAAVETSVDELIEPPTEIAAPEKDDTDTAAPEKDDTQPKLSQRLNIFNEPGPPFTLKYPEGWSYEMGDDAVLFSSPLDDDGYQMNLTVLGLLSQQAGGDYADLSDFVELSENYFTNNEGEMTEYWFDEELSGNNLYPVVYIFGYFLESDVLYIDAVFVVERDSNRFYMLDLVIPYDMYESMGAEAVDEIIETIYGSFEFTDD